MELKAIEILKMFINGYAPEDEDIEEAIKELQDLETKIIEQDEAIAVDRLMNEKLQVRNRELSNQIALNNPFENRSCENCNSFSIYRGEYGICDKGFNNRRTSYLHNSFSCNAWESKQ